jgi:hypothetical protein
VGSAIAFSVIGRLVQSLQYGVVLHAVGGIATPTAVWATQGTHLVGAALGDLVPGQVGVTEAAYGVFATTLGLGGQPARALSIALMARIAQVALAVGCIFISFLSRPRAPVSSPQPGGD